MMTTHSCDFNSGRTGLTLTTELFAVGSDTAAYTAGSTTAATNRYGFYRAAFTSVAAGTYNLIARVGTLQKCAYRVVFAGVDTEVVEPIEPAVAAATGGALLLASSYTAAPSASTIAAAVRDVSNATPAAGSLGEAVNDGIGAGGATTVVVQPLNSRIDERVSATDIQCYRHEDGWEVGPTVVTDANNNPVDLSAYTTLKLVIEDPYETDLLVTTSITVSGTDSNQWSATGTAAVTAKAPAKCRWALWGLNTGQEIVLGRGTVIVTDVAHADA